MAYKSNMTNTLRFYKNPKHQLPLFAVLSQITKGSRQKRYIRALLTHLVQTLGSARIVPVPVCNFWILYFEIYDGMIN